MRAQRPRPVGPDQHRDLFHGCPPPDHFGPPSYARRSRVHPVSAGHVHATRTLPLGSRALTLVFFLSMNLHHIAGAGGRKRAARPRLGPGLLSGLRLVTAEGWCAGGGGAAAGRGWWLVAGGWVAGRCHGTAPRGARPPGSPGVPETGRCDFDQATSVGYTRDLAHERARCGFAQSAFVVFKHTAGAALRLRRALWAKSALGGPHSGDFRRRPARDPSKNSQNGRSGCIQS